MSRCRLWLKPVVLSKRDCHDSPGTHRAPIIPLLDALPASPTWHDDLGVDCSGYLIGGCAYIPAHFRTPNPAIE